MTQEQKATIDAAIAEVRYWVDGYLEAGFSEEQAVAFICRPLVNIQPSQYPPEFMEAMQRQTALASKMLTELES